MSAENETITDIVAAIRRKAQYLIESAEASARCGETMAGTPYTEENLEFARQDAKEMLAEADRLEAAMKREVENAKALGNAAKLREALEETAQAAAEIMERVRLKDGLAFNTANYIIGVAKTALASPLRNCDVGTAEEQLKRQYDTMCNTTKACPDADWSCRECFAKWAQILYKEGGKK